MSAGKLQQVGAPKEIYTRPVNRFVASFIGETNFLTATQEAGGARLATGDLIELASGGAQGRKLTITIRPEQLRLCDPAEAGALAATVANLVYFGTDTHCHMTLADGSEMVARLQSPALGDAGLATGQKVGLRFQPGAAQVLED
jgi:spermidine/putrescine transport system ATP-binding protein